jgi:hypothetical protein
VTGAHSKGLYGRITRHRVATALLLAFLVAQPSTADDRQLLHANSGAQTNVLLILDSSHSMTNDFSGRFNLPAYMDDFLYPQGTFAVVGSKIGVAKSVIREVLTKTAGVNWGFAYYRNPNQQFGASQALSGIGTDGAKLSGQTLANGGVEWLYFADTLSGGGPISKLLGGPFDPNEYPDIQQGRFMQFGHKVGRTYKKYDTGDVADIRPPYPSTIQSPVSYFL